MYKSDGIGLIFLLNVLQFMMLPGQVDRVASRAKVVARVIFRDYVSRGNKNRKMKIIYLHQYFNTPEMAGGTRSYEMARRLVSAGHEVHMITTDRQDQRSGSGWRQSNEGGIIVHWVSVPYDNKMSFFSRIKAFFSFALKARKKAASLGGDVVFATSTPLTIAIPGVYAARKNKIPLVFEVRDLWPDVPIALGALKDPLSRYLAKRLERYAYDNSSHIVALAPGMRDEIIAKGYGHKNFTVIPNGSDLDVFKVPEEAGQVIRKEHDWLQDRPLMIYCGQVSMAFGMEYLAHLAKEVYQLDDQIRIAVIGDGNQWQQLKDKAEEFAVLDKNLFLLGSMVKKDLAKWFSAADMSIALFTGPRIIWKDGVQNKFFDSLAASRPVAINYDGWQSRIALEADAGIIISSNDYSAAAALLVNKLRDRSWLKQAGERAHILALERFNRNLLAEKLNKVFIDIKNNRA